MIGIIVVMRATNEKNVREKKKKKWERKCGKSLGMQKKKKEKLRAR